ncbi:MAG: hypothetical protein ACWGOX_13525, partial [Desulforhopalus sp.]
MNLTNCAAKFKSFFLGSLCILAVTIILLEISSYVMFEPLTGEKFSYALSATDRRQQISRLKEGLDTADFQENALYQFHPYVGYINKPGAHPWSQNNMTFNDYGMSSVAKRNYPYKKKQNEFVLAILGGSVAEIFANTGEGYLNHYLRTLYGVQKDVVFINLATGGYKQPQQLFHLQYALLSGFEFDAVLNIDGFNDLVLASVNLDQNVHPVFPSAGHIGLLSKIQSNNVLDRQSVKYLSNYYRLLDTQLAMLSLMQKKPFKYSIFLTLAEAMLTKKYNDKIKNLKYEWTIEASQTL